MKKIAYTLLYGALLLLSRTLSGQECPVKNRHTEIAIKEHTLTAEVATNMKSQNCGLAFRDKLPPDHGMLFAFAKDRRMRFWMKNTRIPLSIAFIDAEGNILEIHNMDPNDPSHLYISKSLARYALEVNQGWFKQQDIAIGDSANFDLRAIRDSE